MCSLRTSTLAAHPRISPHDESVGRPGDRRQPRRHRRIGTRRKRRLARLGLQCCHVQLDTIHPTVNRGERSEQYSNGQPSFEIAILLHGTSWSGHLRGNRLQNRLTQSVSVRSRSGRLNLAQPSVLSCSTSPGQRLRSSTSISGRRSFPRKHCPNPRT